MSRPKFLLYSLGFLVLGSGIVWAGTMSLSTYYPAPTGYYNQLYAQTNVGIGTTVVNNEGLLVLASQPWTTSNYGANIVVGGNNINAIGLLDSSSLLNWAMADNAGSLQFSRMPVLGPLGTPTTVMTLSPTGNVGINNTAPGHKLDIEGMGGANIDLNVNGEIQSGDASDAGGMWVNNTETEFVGQSPSGQIGFKNGGVWGLQVDTSGDANVLSNVVAGNQGIFATDVLAGTYVQAGKYVQAGTYVTAGTYVQAGTDVTAGATITLKGSTGNISATSADVGTGGLVITLSGGTVFAPSDERLKQNIVPLTDTLAKIDQLRGVSFEWNHLSGHREGEKNIGMIAQEMQKVYPELVGSFKNGHQEYLSIDYMKFTAVLLQAVKELKSQTNAMQDQINVLQKKVKTLEKQK